METRFLDTVAKRIRLSPCLPHALRHTCQSCSAPKTFRAKATMHFRNKSIDSFASPRELEQAHPLGGYYLSILSTATTPSSKTPPPLLPHLPPIHPSTTSVSVISAVAPESPAVLSSATSSFGEHSQLAQKPTSSSGTTIPPRPTEPEDCCMSGCVNCVWECYQEEVAEWNRARRRDADPKSLSADTLVDETTVMASDSEDTDEDTWVEQSKVLVLSESAGEAQRRGGSNNSGTAQDTLNTRL